MANKYPYVASAGPISGTVEQLKKAFPEEVTAETLKKWGLAPNNESYVLNILRFLGLLDDAGKKQKEAAKVFLKGNDEFAKGFERLVQVAYGSLFESFADEAWELPAERLVQFFRTEDESTETVGKRQAGTFRALAALAGHGELPALKPKGQTKRVNGAKPMPKSKSDAGQQKPIQEISHQINTGGHSNVGLTVRIEVNLPAVDDQNVYDKIFKSIRENLLNGK